ncbi:MAG: homoserine kinase [Hyphomicrobiaceae bacterium]
MAVYTEVSDDDMAAFAESYGLGELLSFKGIAEGVENSNYLVVCSSGQYILTLYEKRVRPSDLPFFLGLMEHLAASGFPCPVPLRDAQGRNLRQLCGRPAAMISFLSGLWVRRPKVIHCHLAGQALARMHEAGCGYLLERDNALGPSGWRHLFDRFAGEADQISQGLRDTIERELEFVRAQWPCDLPAGVIHADLFPDNIFFRGEQVTGVIDFYFACNDYFAFDVAVCLNAWCFEADYSFNVTKGRALLSGYQSVRRMAAEECAALPILARGAALRFLLTRAFDWLNTAPDAFVRPHDPVPYLRRLRFHQAIGSVSEYGLEIQ